jgi:hypothetical protein
MLASDILKKKIRISYYTIRGAVRNLSSFSITIFQLAGTEDIDVS